jgi:hypothetical protein
MGWEEGDPIGGSIRPWKEIEINGRKDGNMEDS